MKTLYHDGKIKKLLGEQGKEKGNHSRYIKQPIKEGQRD